MKVTVVIPTRDRPGYLREAIESVLQQTYSDFTLLISDNASKPGTRDVVHKFDDNRIVYHRHVTNIGVQKNWQFALTWPERGIVALLEDDNIWISNHLEDGLTFLNKTGKQLYSCGTKSFGTITDQYFGPDIVYENYIWNPTCSNYYIWLSGNQFAASSVILRRETLDSLYWGGWHWPWCMDYLWWGQIALSDGFIFNPDIRVRYRWHESNLTHEFRGPRAAAQFRFVVRKLAEVAMRKGLVSTLADDLQHLSKPALSTAIVALSALDSPTPLRKGSQQMFELLCDAGDVDISDHIRVAKRLGTWYLGLADILDRVRGLWWPLRQFPKL